MNICPRCSREYDGHYKTCPDCRRRNNEVKAAYRARNISKGLCESCGIRPPDDGLKRCRVCLDGGNKTPPERKKVLWGAWHSKLRRETIGAYGGRCACCGEDDWRFLTVDHTHSNGAEHRKMRHGKIYSFLKQHNFPQGPYQLLCMNCNWAKGIYGRCPHEMDRDSDGDS